MTSQLILYIAWHSIPLYPWFDLILNDIVPLMSISSYHNKALILHTDVVPSGVLPTHASTSGHNLLFLHYIWFSLFGNLISPYYYYNKLK